MVFGTVYKIVFPNGKHYIGITVRELEQRKKEHKRYAKNGDTTYVYNALRKYEMMDIFDLIEIDTANTLEELYDKEINYIKEYNSYYKDGKGYNMTYGGGNGVHGYVWTEDDKQKMSKIKKKYYEENPEARNEMSEKLKKYYEENPEERKEHSEKIKKYYKENSEARKENSERLKKYYEENPEAAKKHSERLKKYFKENPEASKKYGEIKKKHFEENPEAGKELSETRKKYYKENPEAGKEHSEKIKKYFEENPEAVKENNKKIKKYYEENPEAKKKLLDRRGRNKSFDIFTKDGTFIKTCTYQFEAVEYLKKEYNITSNISIGYVLAGKRNSSAGFVFKYK